MDRTLVVGGGTLITDGARVKADVLIRDGTIAGVGRFGARDGPVISAHGCLVLPGGVDAHTHVFGAPASDGMAALHGGTTSALTFVDAAVGETPRAAAERGHHEQVPQSPIDLGFHGVIWEPDSYRVGDLADLAEYGVTSIKLWLAYEELGIMANDGAVYEIMREAASEGVLVQAHCENGPVIGALVRRMRSEGRTALSEHAVGRPIALEAEAVHRFLRIAGIAGADAYVVHVSGREPLHEIIRARERGQTVFAEVCTHHLAFDDRVYAGADPLRYMMTPPLRAPDDVATLWRALADGTLDVCASDHDHLRMDPDKLAARGDVTSVPYGVPGIQWRLPLAFSLGLERGRLTPERLVEIACTAPARIFGLYPQKGTLRVGADADLVVWDPQPRSSINGAAIRDGLDYSPYEGMELVGTPRIVMAGGEVVVREGEFLGRATPGRFLPRPRRRSVSTAVLTGLSTD